MDFMDDVLPEEYVDIVMQEFAYDPIKFSSKEDPSQVLYNRRTLETIWDTKRTAFNPYTLQAFQICNVVPQNDLKQQMCQYLLNNESVTLSLGLEVIPDYSQILNETEMIQLLNELVFAGKKCLRILNDKNRPARNRNIKLDDEELEHWKALWKKLNLVRLYCQYRPENRDVFSSINGYKYLFQVIDMDLVNSCRKYSRFSCDDAKEVRKEVARIVDVMGGLKVKDLLMAPERSVSALLYILFDLKHSGHLKTLSMVLRIYRGMFDPLIIKCSAIGCMVKFAFYVLSGWDSPRDIVNEDLYNGMTILRAGWTRKLRLFENPQYVWVLCMVVTVCISRLQELHDAFTAHQAQTISCSSSQKTDHEYQFSNSCTSGHDNGEMEKNIHFISMALEHGLFLISSLLTPPHSEEQPYSYAASRETLQITDIVKQIVVMVKLILADNKFFHSSHLQLGLKITESLHIEESNLRVLKDFLGSKYVDQYGIEIKQLVRYQLLRFHMKFHKLYMQR